MMQRKVSRRALLALLGAGAGAIGLSACASPVPSAPASGAAPTSAAAPTAPAAAAAAAAAATSTSTTSTSGQPRSGGKLVAAKLGDVANLDGHYWSPNGGLHVWLAYDTLARYDQNLKPQPQLAESWDVASAFQHITVNLRKGVTYHSGREFTAA